MSIKRVDFTVKNYDEKIKMSLLYDDTAITKEQAEQIINDPRLQMNEYNNQLLKKDTPCFFLPTSHANLLQRWVREELNTAKNVAIKLSTDENEKET